MDNPDPDLLGRSNEQLRIEIMSLREAIRYHRDQEEDDRCHEDDLKLYALMPEKKGAKTTLPPKEVFLKSCERFWNQRQEPGCMAALLRPKNDQAKKELVDKLVDGSAFLGDYGGRVEFARLLVKHGLYYQADSHLKHELRRRDGGKT